MLALIAADAATGDPWALLLQYGVLGVVVVGFITGWIVPGPQAKQLLEENRRLQALIENKLLPMSETYAATLEKSAIVMEKCTTVLDQIVQAQARQLDGRERDRARGR